MKAIAALMLAALPLVAAEEASPTEQLLEVIGYEETTKQAIAEMTGATVAQYRAQGMSEDSLAEVTEITRDFYTRSFLNPEVKRKMCALYESRFTAAEIEQLVAFYKTTAGRKMVTELPLINNESRKISIEATRNHVEAYQAKVRAIIQENGKAPTLPPTQEEQENNHSR